MFDSLFPKHWTTLQRLMWLKTNALARAVYEIVTGNPVTFTAKAAPLRQLKVAFSPVQSLNGYDAPWPAGGGKNVLDFKAALDFWGATYTENADGSFTVTNIGYGYTRQYQFASEDATYTMSAVSLINGSSASGWGVDFVSASGSGTGVIREGSLVAAGKTACKIRLNYSQPGDGFTIKNIQIEAGSTATAWTPYSNECPISGWSSLTVEQRGKNLFGPNTSPTENNFINESGLVLTTEGWTVSDWIPVAHNTQYTFTPNSTEGNAAKIWFYDADKTGISYIASGAQTFTTPANCRFMRFSYRDTSTDIMLNLGETAEAYVPYNGRSISISLGETVYSGYVDVISGVGEVTWVMASSAWGNMNVTYTGDSFTNKNMPFDAGALSGASNSFTNCVSSYIDSSTYQSAHYYVSSNLDMAFVSLANDTPSDFVVQVCAKLETPIPISLTPQEVESLAGDNTMWSNANQPITVEYRKN